MNMRFTASFYNQKRMRFNPTLEVAQHTCIDNIFK